MVRSLEMDLFINTVQLIWVHMNQCRLEPFFFVLIDITSYTSIHWLNLEIFHQIIEFCSEQWSSVWKFPRMLNLLLKLHDDQTSLIYLKLMILS